MKKDFFLSKGLEKFSSKELKSMENIIGGALYVPVEIHYPTGGGGRLCPQGMVWSNSKGKCVSIIAVEEKEEYKLSL